MDKAPLHIDLDSEDLAHACEERAQALHARAWRSEAERDALREATADLLSAVARQLSALAPIPVAAPGLSPAELRETLATRVVHECLTSTDAGIGMADPTSHAWVGCFKPGTGSA